MVRKAFLMSVNAGAEGEYKRRHNPVWPEVQRVLEAHGVSNYSIFLHPSTLRLFAYVELEDEALWQAIAATPECRRWWRHMADVMPHNGDGSPVQQDLHEMFHLD